MCRLQPSERTTGLYSQGVNYPVATGGTPLDHPALCNVSLAQAPTQQVSWVGISEGVLLLLPRIALRLRERMRNPDATAGVHASKRMGFGVGSERDG